MTPRLIRVLVVDDQAIVRDGLVTVLSLLPDIEVVGEASNGIEAVRLVDDRLPDVVLMDLRMPMAGAAAASEQGPGESAQAEGATATRAIVAKHPQVAVLALTTYADDASLLGALAAGARGYLTKDATRQEVASAIRAVASGQTTFAPGIGARLIERFTGQGDDTNRDVAAGAAPDDAAEATPLTALFPQLTPRETEVLGLVADGLNNSEIATRMFVSVVTVKAHINAIFAKLGVRDRAQAIVRVQSERRRGLSG